MDINTVSQCTSDDFQNVTDPKCRQILAMAKIIYVSKPGFSFNEEPTTELVQEAVQDGDLYPFPIADEIEDAGKDKEEYEASSGRTFTMRDAIKGMRLMFTLSAYQFVNMLSFDDEQVRVFVLDHKGNFYGTDLDGDGSKFAGWLTSRFDVENLETPTEVGTPARTPVVMQFANTQEYRSKLAVFSDKEDFSSVEGLLDVTVTVSESSTSSVKVLITSTATGKGVKGLSTDTTDLDFEILDDASSSVSIDAISESDATDGLYTLTATLAAGTYTVDLLDTSEMETDGYDSTGAAEFTTS